MNAGITPQQGEAAGSETASPHRRMKPQLGVPGLPAGTAPQRGDLRPP